MVCLSNFVKKVRIILGNACKFKIHSIYLTDHCSLPSLGQLSQQWPNFLYWPLLFSFVAHQVLPVDSCMIHLSWYSPFQRTGKMQGLCLSLETVTQSTFPKTLKYWRSWSVHGNIGYQVLKKGIKNSQDSYTKINLLRGYDFILSIDIVARCQKVPKYDLKVNFLYQKSSKYLFSLLKQYEFMCTFFVSILKVQ